MPKIVLRLFRHYFVYFSQWNYHPCFHFTEETKQVSRSWSMFCEFFLTPNGKLGNFTSITDRGDGGFSRPKQNHCKAGAYAHFDFLKDCGSGPSHLVINMMCKYLFKSWIWVWEVEIMKVSLTLFVHAVSIISQWMKLDSSFQKWSAIFFLIGSLWISSSPF